MSDSPSLTMAKDAYEAAHQAAVVVDRSALGVLTFHGASRLDLIHRMSTQAVRDLAPGTGAATVLTTDIGRVVDRLILYAGDDAVTALTGEGNGANVARYLLRFVFFNDDFVSREREAAILGVYGRQATSLLRAAYGVEVALPRHHWQPARLAGIDHTIHAADPVAGDGFLLICEAAEREALWAALVAAGIHPADEPTFDYLRIESAVPRFGRELTLDYIPLEANLWDDVSFQKGCYIGQEIIARMESRGRLAKRLLRLRPARPLAPGAELRAGGRPAGIVTSAVDGPAGPLALGYVKTATLETGEPLLAGDIPVTPDPV